MKYFQLFTVYLFLAFSGSAQIEKEVFSIQTELKHTPVISQGSTGNLLELRHDQFPGIGNYSERFPGNRPLGNVFCELCL